MTFTKPEQEKHRKAFIDECRPKAWGAACHADWISKGVDDIMAHYQKLQVEDRALEEAIKAAEVAVDYHTVENRNKRKSMQERRNTLAQQMKLIGENAQQGQRSLEQLYARAWRATWRSPSTRSSGSGKRRSHKSLKLP